MVILYDGWQIDTDAYQYILEKKVSYTNKKGEPDVRYDDQSYHLSLSQALQAFYNDRVRQCIGENEYTLVDAISMAKHVEERIRSLATGPKGF